MHCHLVALVLLLSGCSGALADSGSSTPTGQQPVAGTANPDSEVVWWGGAEAPNALMSAAHTCGLPDVQITYWTFPEENRHMIPGVSIPNLPADPRLGCVMDWIRAHPKMGFE
jgi:hypothetical protein